MSSGTDDGVGASKSGGYLTIYDDLNLAETLLVPQVVRKVTDGLEALDDQSHYPDPGINTIVDHRVKLVDVSSGAISKIVAPRPTGSLIADPRTEPERKKPGSEPFVTLFNQSSSESPQKIATQILNSVLNSVTSSEEDGTSLRTFDSPWSAKSTESVELSLGQVAQNTSRGSSSSNDRTARWKKFKASITSLKMKVQSENEVTSSGSRKKLQLKKRLTDAASALKHTLKRNSNGDLSLASEVEIPETVDVEVDAEARQRLHKLQSEPGVTRLRISCTKTYEAVSSFIDRRRQKVRESRRPLAPAWDEGKLYDWLRDRSNHEYNDAEHQVAQFRITLGDRTRLPVEEDKAVIPPSIPETISEHQDQESEEEDEDLVEDSPDQSETVIKTITTAQKESPHTLANILTSRSHSHHVIEHRPESQSRLRPWDVEMTLNRVSLERRPVVSGGSRSETRLDGRKHLVKILEDVGANNRYLETQEYQYLRDSIDWRRRFDDVMLQLLSRRNAITTLEPVELQGIGNPQTRGILDIVSLDSGRRRELVKRFLSLQVQKEFAVEGLDEPPIEPPCPTEYVDSYCDPEFTPFMDRTEYDIEKHLKYPLYGGGIQTFYKDQCDRGMMKARAEILNFNEPFRKTCFFSTPPDIANREPTGGY